MCCRQTLGLPKGQVPEESIKDLWNILDSDGDGKVTVQEFSVFVKQCAEWQWGTEDSQKSKPSKQLLETSAGSVETTLI